MLRVLRGISRLSVTKIAGVQQSNTMLQTNLRRFGTKPEYTVTYALATGEKYEVKGREGENLLDIATENNVEIDGFGACEGTLACSTCHLIFDPKDFKNITDIATDEELDMLDLAYGLTDTSRLGCQVCMNKNLDGMVVKVPEGVNDQR